MSEILIEPGNPLSLRREELEPLIAAIESCDASYNVRLAYNEQRGYGVTWWEVLHVWIPWATIGGAAAKKITEVLIDWARHKLEGKASGKRPRSVTIHGPTGKILKKIDVDSKGEEKIEDSIEDDDAPPRAKPPIRD